VTSACLAYTPLGPPRIDRFEAAAQPLRLAPLALLTALEGRLLVRSEGGDAPLRAGELLIVRGALALEIHPASTRVRVAMLHARPDWVDAFCALHGLAPRTAPAAEWLPAAAEPARRATQVLAAAPVHAESGQPSPADTAALVEIALAAEGFLLAGLSASAGLTEQREALIRCLGEPDTVDTIPSLAKLARKLDLSPRQTARIVRSETGRTFRELKAAARLERARRLLASSELSILEVALRSGWTSASQFHEAFRRQVGVTPARYRAATRG
jgi:AraC-like DNA-binding protein